MKAEGMTMTELDFDQFYELALNSASKFKIRKGQALFNLLSEIRPDLSEQIRGTDKDPFYIESNHPNWKRFIEFLEANW